MANKGVAIGVGIAVLVLVIGGIVLLAKSFMKLDTSEVAITYNSFTKKLNDKVFYEGLHVGTPTLTFIKFKSIFQTLSFSNQQCLNIDGVTVSLSISMQYRLRPNYINVIVQQFQDESTYSRMLQLIGSAAIRDVCCLFNTTQLQSERGRFQAELSKQLVDKFNKFHTDIQDLQVNNIIRPRQYDNAIRAKESAREDIEVARSEKPRALTAASTKKREASSEAQIILNEARSEAKIISTKAKSEGEAILNEYKKEAESYKTLKLDNGLDNQGFLSYLGVRAIANAKNPVYVGMKAPAKTSFADEL